MLIAIIPVALIVCVWYLLYKKFIYKTDAQVIQEELDDLNSMCPKWYMVRYGEDDKRWCKVYVVCRWNERIIASIDSLQIQFFLCWLIIKDKKNKKKEENIISSESALFLNIKHDIAHKIHSYTIRYENWDTNYEINIHGTLSNQYIKVSWDIETVTKMINSL